ncbi:hypothetical protein BIV57_06590 [Mangrovactinospora gilvigrisea]|uniref:HTH marR-type domain-containing protein n=1 Tax=Mangrovactinospora gilvigrisea TaxID=1428644 RepID=A0A1J7BXU3_9ACTN|nr:MarR family transcriptional regulator [Mangrovactinospora gilvigrisea]OIV38321.1 hypothetical protein BIV57_06590 [Mangrovactinospora gilvigrisea]
MTAAADPRPPQQPPGADRVAEASAELRALAGRLIRRLRHAARADVTDSQAGVLSRLERHGPATIVALARAEMVRPQSMGATLAALEELGLVERGAHPTDRRQVVMSLTEDGRARLTKLRRLREGWLYDAITTKLTPDEQAVLVEAVGLLDRIVGDEPPEA